MIPLKISETACTEQPTHAINVSLLSIDMGLYQLTVSLWAWTPDAALVRLTLHNAISDQLDSLLADYDQLADTYHATHHFTTDEIEERTNGHFRD